jgi:cell division septation protein DedD
MLKHYINIQLKIIIKMLKITISKIIPTTILFFWILVAHGSPIKNDSLRFEILLSSKMLSDIQINEKFINSMDITSDQFILLSTTDQFYLLGWGGIKPIGQKQTGTIGSFAFTPENLLMTIRNNELCTADSLGNLSKIFGLPSNAMGISAGKYVMYVYDQNKNKEKYALYLITSDGNYKKMFEIPTPIRSIVEMNNSVLFATENAVFSFNLKNKELKALVVLPNKNEIKSIAVDSLNNRIYFSTENAIYALKGSTVSTISADFGGVLKYVDNGLMVFNSEKKLLIRIFGLEDKIVSELQPKETTKPIVNNQQPIKPITEKPITSGIKSSDTLTNTSVVDLVKAKLPDDSIINIINKSKVNFNLSVNAMISLSGQNVSSPVIQAMKNAMKNKTVINPNSNNSNTNVPVTNKPIQNNNPSTTNNTIGKNFYIIAGSYLTEQEANDAVADLKSKGFAEAEVVGKNKYGSYRIAYKGYATNEEATNDLIKIKQSTNPSAWIYKKE